MKIFDLPNLLNINKLKNSQQQKKDSGFKTGDIVEGKILEAKGQALVLMLNSGKLLRLRDLSKHQYQLGDTLKMELVREGELLMGKAIETVDEQVAKEELNEVALKQIGLESTEERKTVVKLLRMNSIPVTKENVLGLTEAKKYVSRLSDLAKGNLIDASKLPIDKNIKTLLVDHLNKSDNLYTPQSGKETLTLKDLINSEGRLNQISDQEDKTLQLKQSINQRLSETASQKPVPNASLINKTSANAFLSEKLDMVEYKSLVFNLKNNVENTVKNLLLLDKIILGSDSVTKQLGRFSKNIEYIFAKSNMTPNSHPTLIRLLKDFEEVSLRDYNKFEAISEKLIEALKSEPEMTAIDKDVLSSQVATIKSSLTYLNDMSQNLVFVQMPVKVNDHVQNMDLYIKKNPRKKDIDPNQCSIFLSLDTENCKTVKSLLELSREKTAITFKLADEDMVAFFNEHLRDLSEILKNKGYHNLLVKAIEFKKDEQHILDEVEEYTDHVIDVKL